MIPYATALDVAAQVDPNLRRDIWVQDDEIVTFGSLSTDVNQSVGQIYFASAAVELRIEGTRTGTGTAAPIVFRLGNTPIETARLTTTGGFTLGSAASTTPFLLVDATAASTNINVASFRNTAQFGSVNIALRTDGGNRAVITAVDSVAPGGVFDIPNAAYFQGNADVIIEASGGPSNTIYFRQGGVTRAQIQSGFGRFVIPSAVGTATLQDALLQVTQFVGGGGNSPVAAFEMAGFVDVIWGAVGITSVGVGSADSVMLTLGGETLVVGTRKGWNMVQNDSGGVAYQRYGGYYVESVTVGAGTQSSQLILTTYLGGAEGTRLRIASTTSTFTPAAATTGSPNLLLMTAPAHTTLTAGTEAIDINWNLARTVQFATGAITTQRAFVVQAPTYAFVLASTITTAATFAITGAPVAGTNATITNPFSLWVQGGVSRFDGAVASSVQRAFELGPFGAAAGNTGEIRFLELAAGGTNYVGFKAADAIAANVIWTLPSADGTSGQVLQTNGAGVLSFAAGGGSSAFAAKSLAADQFDNPNNADWTVNALATAEAAPTNAAITIRAFDDTTEEGVGFIMTIPAGTVNILFRFKGRARTAPGAVSTVLPRLYRRTIPDNAAVGAWSAAFAFASLSIPTNANFQYDSETVSLATLSLTAGNLVQFELTRNPADTLTGDYLLAELVVEFQ